MTDTGRTGALRLITESTLPVTSATDPFRTVTRRDLKRWVLTGGLVRHLGRYERAEYVVGHVGAAPTPTAAAVLLRIMSRGDCEFVDVDGRRKRIGWSAPVALAAAAARDWLTKAAMLRRTAGDVASRRVALEQQTTSRRLDLRGRPVYLRTDLWFGVKSGGSVGHIAGVLNNLATFTGEPVFVTTSVVPTVDERIDQHVVPPGRRYWDFPELPLIAFTDTFTQVARPLVPQHASFIYQRYSLNNYSGVTLATERALPFVLEYNGSEVWINRNWGQPLIHEPLSIAIEDLNLAAADLIVVVSRPMRDELVGRGVPSDKILVNPNGVDPTVYSPDVDGTPVRAKYGIADEIVIGFIGTFGAWHGAEVLADAFGRLVAARPELRERVRLMLVGDGIRMPEVRDAIARHGIADRCVLTGLVPQVEGPAHLAACDILASPHVPNPDGTPFFGSPTKLFEYMAMQRPIVASALDQIAEVLDPGTAVLVRPGDAADLVRGLAELIDHPERGARLAVAARRVALERHTWRDHTRTIVEALVTRCS